MMNPEGYFKGNNLYASWNPVDEASAYDIQVDRCSDQGTCSKIFESRSTDPNLTSSSDEFESCTMYTMKVTAKDISESDLIKETILVRKSDRECSDALEMSLIIVLSVLCFIVFALVISIFYYHKKKPIQRIQRARSRVYSRIYPVEKYLRPFDKSLFLMNYDIHGTDFSNQVSSRDKPDTIHLAERGFSRLRQALTEEFYELEQLSEDTIQRKISASCKPVNKRRNRYQDIVPFDSTRVKLNKPIRLEGEPEPSDFINASYISDIASQELHQKGALSFVRASGRTGRLGLSRLLPKLQRRNRSKKPTATQTNGLVQNGTSFHAEPIKNRNHRYIAAQGPADETSLLFWEMIWQQNIRVIVMLTKVTEFTHSNNSIKCSQYWPVVVGEKKRYADLEIQLYDVQEAPDYRVHKLELSRKSAERSKEIVHIQCTAWPDRSAPKEANTLLQLIEVTRALSNQYDDPKSPGPWLVHCSAGVGRTGTFIAVDQLLQIVDDDRKKEIDIFNLIYQLRKDRRFLVQTEAQYDYVYRCVWEYLKRKEDQRIREKSNAN